MPVTRTSFGVNPARNLRNKNTIEHEQRLESFEFSPNSCAPANQP